MKAVRTIAYILSAAALVACSACSGPQQPAYQPSDTVKVTFVDNGLYRVKGGVQGGNTFFVKKGEDLTVAIEPDDGLFLSETDYAGSGIFYEETQTRVILPRVLRSQRVRLEFVESSGTIVYDANGGDFQRTEEDFVLVPYDLSHHIRQNTDIGRDLSREGYTLIGWNTAADGSGEHVGLGGRISVNEGGTSMLFAEWAPWSDVSDFTYEPENDGSGMRLTGYHGDAVTVCIPARIEGIPVTRINTGCFEDCSAETVILPNTELAVKHEAFRNCALKELYLFDNIESISDESFLDCPDFSTLHINAVETPKWTDFDRHSNLADKYDILIEHEEAKKIVVFGGSGSFFSVDTRQMTDDLADMGYVVINMAINAHFNAYMQFEMIEPYMREGDILVHIPEVGIAQMMGETSISDVRIWHGLESNFDLVSDIDIRGVDNLFDSFTSFNLTRAMREDKSYADYVQEIDDLGNWGCVDQETGEFTTYKPERGTDTPFTHEAMIETKFLSGEAVARRKSVYRAFEEKGVRVFLSNAALNVDGLAYELYGGGGDEGQKLEQCRTLARTFDTYNERAFSEYTVLVGINDCLYRGGRFYNSDYHLGSEAAEEHTALLLTRLKEHLGE